MNRILFSFCALLLSICALAQTADNMPWCPQNATWLYRKGGLNNTSYYRYTYSSDTIIQGMTARKMKCTVIAYIAPPGYPPSVAAGSPEFYRNSNDSIYWWNGSQFQFIYHFAAQTGDRWVERNSRYTPCAASAFPTQDTLTVRSVTDVNLGGRIFQKYDVRSDSQYFYTGAVLRNIGSLVAPYPLMNEGKCFFLQFPNGGFDPNTFDQLICYYDDLRGFVPVFTGNAPTCFDLMGYIVASLPATDFSSLGWKTGPNPARESFQVTGAPADASYRLYSPEGQTVRSGRMGNGRISVAGLTPGLYLLEITYRGRKVVTKMVRQ